MNRIILPIILIILLSITITVGVFKPGLNKPVKFALTDYKIENTDNTHIENKNIQISDTDNTKKAETILEIQETNTTSKTINVKTSDNTTSKTVNVKRPENEKTNLIKNIFSGNTSSTKEKQVKITLPDSVTKTVTKTQPETPVTKQIIQTPPSAPVVKVKDVEIENRPLTEQEEIIVWNKWHSNLQNQIMYDTKISAPLGTTFKFSFTVDRAGRISNLMAWSDTPAYNAIAQTQLKPLISSYQGKAILNFPPRTKRIFTNAQGGFAISTASKYSTPEDYSDIEKVRQ